VPRVVAISAALSVLVLSAGCGAEQEEKADECAHLESVSLSPELAELVDLGDTVTFVHQEVTGDVATAEGVSTGSIRDVLAASSDAFEAAGWHLLQVEDEGFDAEVFASGPHGELGIVALRLSDCPDETLVTLTIDRGEPAAPENQA
jgi:hypothetical protein